MSNQPRSMCIPRMAKGMSAHPNGWFYVQPKHVEVVAPVRPGSTVGVVRLTERQLKRALEIMETSREDDSL